MTAIGSLTGTSGSQASTSTFDNSEALRQLANSVRLEREGDQQRATNLERINAEDDNRTGAPFGTRINTSRTNSIVQREATIRRALEAIRNAPCSPEQKAELTQKLIALVGNISAQNFNINGRMRQISSTYRDMPGWGNIFMRGVRNASIANINGDISGINIAVSHRENQLRTLDGLLAGLTSGNQQQFTSSASSLLGTQFTLRNQSMNQNDSNAIAQSNSSAQTQMRIADNTVTTLRVAQEGLAHAGGATAFVMSGGNPNAYSAGYRGIQILQNGTEALANLGYGTQDGARSAFNNVITNTAGLVTDRMPGPTGAIAQNLIEQGVSGNEINVTQAVVSGTTSYVVGGRVMRGLGRGAPTALTAVVSNVTSNLAGNLTNQGVEGIQSLINGEQVPLAVSNPAVQTNLTGSTPSLVVSNPAVQANLTGSTPSLVASNPAVQANLTGSTPSLVVSNPVVPNDVPGQSIATNLLFRDNDPPVEFSLANQSNRTTYAINYNQPIEISYQPPVSRLDADEGVDSTPPPPPAIKRNNKKYNYPRYNLRVATSFFSDWYRRNSLLAESQPVSRRQIFQNSVIPRLMAWQQLYYQNQMFNGLNQPQALDRFA